MESSSENLEALDMARSCLLELRDEWSPELPTEFMLSAGNYKFRGNWFQGVASACMLVADVCGNEDLMSATNEFAMKRRGKDVQERTTAQEIWEGDQLIERALQILDQF